MKLNNCTMTSKNSSPDLLSSSSGKRSQSASKLARQSSVQSSTYKQNQSNTNLRRKNLSSKNNDCYIRHTASTFSVPLLVDTMNSFYQAADSMEEEIMLPLRLKDMPVDQLILDNTVQPDTWYELYSFVRDIRNQLSFMHLFVDVNDPNHAKEQPKKESNDDEGIVMPNQDTTVQFSATFSEASSDDFEQSSTSSGAASYESIKDELKYHYYGLFRSLDQLTSIANRVTERYREAYLN